MKILRLTVRGGNWLGTNKKMMENRGIYPLVNIQKTMENPPFSMGKSTINHHFQ
jgi:hypothetical protein